MTISPKVSVILTSYNHAEYIRESIESVLKQTYKNFELIIWDDASTDDSWNIISEYTDKRIQVFRNDTNQFMAYFGKAVSDVAQGEYVAIHHSDDVWEPDKLEKQVAYLIAHPEIGAVFSNVLIIGDNSEPYEDASHFYYKIFDQPNRTRHEWLNHFFYHGNVLCHPSVLIRKTCYQDCGPYRYGFGQANDFDMWVRLCLKYDIHVLPEKLIRFRVRSSEMNISGYRPETHIRGEFELFQILNNYRGIKTAEEFTKIFPNAIEYFRSEGFDIGFALGMAALESSTSNYKKLFGLQLLFEALSDPVRAKKINELYQFGHNELIALSAKYDVFSIELIPNLFAQIAEKERVNQALLSQLHTQNLQLVETTNKMVEITSSMAWSLILRLRRMRLWIVPTGGKREKLLRLVFQSLRIWKNAGFSSVYRKAIQKIKPGFLARNRRENLPLAYRTQKDILVAALLDLQAVSEIQPVSSSYDVIILPIIDWYFRFQRPQQIARRFAQEGHRVFYVHTNFKISQKTTIHRIEDGVFDVQLSGSSQINIYSDSVNRQMVDTIRSAFDALRYEFDIVNAICIVDLPFWSPIAFSLRDNFGWKIIYDCMDDHGGFDNTSEKMLQEEEGLVQNSDLILTASHSLFNKLEKLNPNCLLVPNATDITHFRQESADLPKELKRLNKPIIGYYGAISDWFDSELVRDLALARPQWSFVFIGHTFGSDLAPINKLTNVHLLREIPYDKLPTYLHAFDVCIIPFKKTPLTDATNPVKLFEFLSAGKAVVAADLDELHHYTDFIQLASSSKEWLACLEKALHDYAPERVAERINFAAQNTWDDRYVQIKHRIPSLFPKASIIIVTYNNVEYTRLCLKSIYEKTIYPNFEVIVVDNASTDGTPEFLSSFETEHKNIQVIFNKKNEGFARANNFGIAKAHGEYIVLLNNDTVVTRVWLSRLINHLADQRVGLVGSVTNGVSNEAYVEMPFTDINALDVFATKLARERANILTPIKVLAMYCVAGRKEIFQTIGPLDEQFGIGMFEDDDYSLRIRQAGYMIAVAEDVFIHHFGRSGFKILGDERYLALFEENQKKFEAKWNIKWEQHVSGTLAENHQFTADLQNILDAYPDARGVVIFPPTIGWNINLFQRPHQLARAFANKGFLVFFFTESHVDDVSGFKQVSPGLYLVNSPWAIFDIVEHPIIFTLPYNREYLFQLRRPLIVYEVIDDLDVFPGDKAQLQKNHDLLLKETHVVLVTADRLMEQVERIRPDAIMCPNAVELDHFSKARGSDIQSMPADLGAIMKTDRPIIGYYGALARWFDYDLVRQAAQKHPEWDFVLIGPDHDNTLMASNILSMSNVHWLGARDYSQLPSYLRHFTVATIPFLVNNITLATSPIKLFEYMAAGKPIVTSDMPECRKYPGVLVAHDTKEYIDHLEYALTLINDSAYLQQLYQTAQENTWEVRVEQIVSALETHQDYKSPIREY